MVFSSPYTNGKPSYKVLKKLNPTLLYLEVSCVVCTAEDWKSRTELDRKKAATPMEPSTTAAQLKQTYKKQKFQVMSVLKNRGCAHVNKSGLVRREVERNLQPWRLVVYIRRKKSTALAKNVIKDVAYWIPLTKRKKNFSSRDRKKTRMALLA